MNKLVLLVAVHAAVIMFTEQYAATSQIIIIILLIKQSTVHDNQSLTLFSMLLQVIAKYSDTLKRMAKTHFSSLLFEALKYSLRNKM